MTHRLRPGLNGATVTIEIGRHGARSHGPLLGVGLHSSSVPVVVFANDGLEVRSSNRVTRAQAVAIRAGVKHALRAEGPVTLWYVEPGLVDWFDRPVTVLGRTRRQWLVEHDRELISAPGRTRHPAVRRVLRALKENPDGSVASFARDARLSSSRLRQVFREHAGINLSRFRWWLRLRLAALAIRSGRSLTEAAHEAGFSDAAHFIRTFRRMFGFPPSVLLVAARWG